jgi:octaprenyl-diphosphate synthase
MTQLALSRAVLDRLAHVSTARGAPSLGDRLATLDRWVRADLIAFEAELSTIPRGTRVVHAAAHHLLDLRGKHLRPLCVALASRFGDGFTDQARALAVAVELIHSATLLHDDVVDVAERRRGEPAACVVYGNAASIFAGDWLLVAALRRIAAAGVDGLLDRMLGVIDEMITAESVQLERRGNVTGTRDDYFAIVEGKTAALFRWAMIAGARVARLTAAAEAALERFGLHLGVAFQAVDDELDYADGTGKDPLPICARATHVPAGGRARARRYTAGSRCSPTQVRAARRLAGDRATGALVATRRSPRNASSAH